MTAPIEVLELRRLADPGNLKGFAKVRLGAVVIHSCRIIQQPGKKPWVALPQIPARKKADGAGAGWYPVVEIISPDLMARVRTAVLEAWEEREQRQPAQRGDRARRPPTQNERARAAGRALADNAPAAKSQAPAEPFHDDIADAWQDLTGEPWQGDR